MIVVVHPLDFPLFKALFEGELDIVRFFEKRSELARRHERGELLGELIEEATTFAASYLPKKRGPEAKEDAPRRGESRAGELEGVRVAALLHYYITMSSLPFPPFKKASSGSGVSPCGLTCSLPREAGSSPKALSKARI